MFVRFLAWKEHVSPTTQNPSLSMTWLSGKRGVSRPPTPLRTVRAGFPAYGSSTSKAPLTEPGSKTSANVSGLEHSTLDAQEFRCRECCPCPPLRSVKAESSRSEMRVGVLHSMSSPPVAVLAAF